MMQIEAITKAELKHIISKDYKEAFCNAIGNLVHFVEMKREGINNFLLIEEKVNELSLIG